MSTNSGKLKFLTLTSAISVIFLVLVILNIFPLGIKSEWTWEYSSTKNFDGIWFPVLVSCILLLLCYNLIAYKKLTGSKPPIEFIHIVLICFLSYLFNIAICYLNTAGFYNLILTIISPWATGYFNVAVEIRDISYWLSNFHAFVEYAPLHARVHPPGNILFFWWIIHIFNSLPTLTDSLLNMVKSTTFNPLPVFSVIGDAFGHFFSDAEKAASVFLSLSLPFLKCAVIIPMYYLGKLIYGKKTALVAVCFYAVIPALNLFTPGMDQTYTLVSVLSFYLFCLSIKKNNIWFTLLSGLVLSIGIMLSFCFLVILGLIICYGLIWFWINKTHLNYILKSFLVLFVAFTALPLLFYLLYDFNIIKFFVSINVFSENARLDIIRGEVARRTYWKWLLYNPVDFFLFVGIPISVLSFRSIYSIIKSGKIEASNILSVAFFSILFLLLFSGINRSEVARLWMFLMPFPALIAASQIKTKTSSAFLILLSLQILQTIVFKLFINVYGIIS
ncbi:MAG: hypothetical protein ABIK53_08440 [bacterium]